MLLHHTLTTAVAPSPRVSAVAGMFGLGVDRSHALELIPPTQLQLHAHQLVFITGESGGGKTTLLRRIEQAVRAGADGLDPKGVIRFDALPELPDRPLVDALPGASLEHTLRLLSLAGLNDAFVMLRKPRELSDGQRYRLRLAQTMAVVENAGCGIGDRGCQNRTSSIPDPRSPMRAQPRAVVIADEFGATLDRMTAKTLARHVRRWVDRQPVCFVAATTHDDLLEPLEPDVLIEKRIGSGLEMAKAGSAENTESAGT